MLTKAFAAIAFCMAVSVVCPAEARWCSISHPDPSNTLLYPPIARAARVEGVVVTRIIYEPNGRVVRTEPVFGPPLLSDSLNKQLLKWNVNTAAAGDQQCVTLMIADFRINDADRTHQPVPSKPSAPGILRVSVETEVLVISDPAGTLTVANPFKFFVYELRSVAKHLVH